MATSDRRRDTWSWTGPHFPMEDVYSVLATPAARRRGCWRAAAAAGSARRSVAPTTSARPGRRPPTGRSGSPTTPTPTSSASGSWSRSAGRRRGLGRHRAGRRLPLHRPRRDVRAGRGLWNHPHRPEWNAGYGGQAFHTILPHPTEPDSVLAALSTGGVYATTDGGKRWDPSNTGVKCEFMPEGQQFPEFGQCVHKVARHPSAPDQLFLQNHGGVYRSDDEAARGPTSADLPSEFGFPVVVDPTAPGTAYLFPIEDAGARCPRTVTPSSGAPATRGRAGSRSARSAARRLPRRGDARRDVRRRVGHRGPAGLYFGGRNGAVWASPDAGETWAEVNRDLPDVMVCGPTRSETGAAQPPANRFPGHAGSGRMRGDP